MAVFLLLVVSVLAANLAQTSILAPLTLVQWPEFPLWLGMGTVVLAVAWCLDD